MRRVVIVFFVSACMIGAGIVQAENKITVKSMPPVVVKTFPQAGDTAVDPSIKEISVTFSKEMMTKDMWSWVMVSKESFPNITWANAVLFCSGFELFTSPYSSSLRVMVEIPICEISDFLKRLITADGFFLMM